LPSLDDHRAHRLEELAVARPPARRHDTDIRDGLRGNRSVVTLGPGAGLGLHVFHLDAGEPTVASRVSEGAARVLGVQVDLDEVVVRDHENALSQLVDARLESPLVAREAVDEELRAIAPGLLRRVNHGLPQALPAGLGCFLFLVHRRELFSTQGRHKAVQDHRHPEPSGVDDPRLGQHIEQIRGPLYRGVRLPGRRPQHLQAVFLPPLDASLGRTRRILYHGEHRALYGFAHRRVRPLACSHKRGRDPPGV
jgi:hypothetical protein